MAEVIIDYLFSRVGGKTDLQSGTDTVVEFSVLELKDEYNRDLFREKAETGEIEETLYYLLKIGAIKIEGGFLVIYNTMRIERLENDNKALYKKEHYTQLDEYYQNKRQQIHIVGEFARRMINDYKEAMTFVNDYFVMDYDLFLNKYLHEFLLPCMCPNLPNFIILV
jgi:ATP-dependent DNA helicase RecQ